MNPLDKVRLGNSPRQMGYEIKIKDINQLDEKQIAEIKKCVITHGVCLIKKQKLNPSSMDKLSAQFGERIIVPEYMKFNNVVKDYPDVVRISNINQSGQLIQNFKGAEYWHQDGDFNQGKKRQIWSFLYADIVPSNGGATGFCDARHVLDILPKELLELIQKSQICINPVDIPDFKMFDKVRHDKLPPAVYHNIVETIAYSNSPILYLGGIDIAQIVGLTKARSDEIKEQIIGYLTRPDNLYVHNWEQGDIVIWDNMLVYHRSMGGYGNEKRLLYRVQARMFQ